MAEAKKTTKKVAKKSTKAVKTEEKSEKAEAPKAAKKAPKKEINSREFAVIQTGGKQYQVRAGETLKIEKMTGDYKAGDKIVFDQVLLVDNGTDTTIGTPFIDGAKVEAVLEEEGRHKKIEVVKYKQKSRYFKRNGHRQPYFQVRIESIK